MTITRVVVLLHYSCTAVGITININVDSAVVFDVWELKYMLNSEARGIRTLPQFLQRP